MKFHTPIQRKNADSVVLAGLASLQRDRDRGASPVDLRNVFTNDTNRAGPKSKTLIKIPATFSRRGWDLTLVGRYVFDKSNNGVRTHAGERGRCAPTQIAGAYTDMYACLVRRAATRKFHSLRRRVVAG